MKLTYVVVFEQTPNNYCAYIPDLPGCIAAHKTWNGIKAMIKEAIEFHIEGIQLDGEPVPPPQMSIEDALAYHHSTPNDYDGYFPVRHDEEKEDPVAILEVEVEVNLEGVSATAAGG